MRKFNKLHTLMYFLCERFCCLRHSIVYSVPYKHKKVRNFFWHFHTEVLRIPAFFLPPKIVDSCGSQHLALVCHTKRRENLQNPDVGPFFFFFFFFEITLKPDKKDEKIFGIFTLSLERSHYLRHFRRR